MVAIVKEKVCFKCQKLLPLSGFYRHPKMQDGYVNKCKECNKADVRANRAKNLDHYREYDRARGNRQSREYTMEYRSAFPNKYKAQTMVSNAIRDKKLFPEPCAICSGMDVHAHHDDYLKPLNVRWLCAAHHSQWHKKNGEGANGS